MAKTLYGKRCGARGKPLGELCDASRSLNEQLFNQGKYLMVPIAFYQLMKPGDAQVLG
jgi:hypothetical protein